MPHQALKLIAGVDQNKTPALNEAAISYSNLIRFIPDRNNVGLVQKLGGWTQFFTNPIGSVVRTLLAWEDINANAWLGVGAEASLSAITEGGLKAITPQTTTANVAVSFTTTTGSTGNIVTIDATGSNLDQYDVVDIQTQVSVGGLVLFGAYPVTFVSTNQFRILATNIFGEPQYATAAVTTGGSVPSFAFTGGLSTVTVTLADHGLVVGNTFPVLVSLSAGSVTIFGNYIVSSVPSSSTFVINASTAASTTPTLTATGNGTTATLTYSTSYTIPVGSTIVVAGVTPGGYNGTFTVTASSAGSVSYANATTGAQTVAGTIFVSVAKENGGNARYVYYNGIGPLQANSGYGVGGYGVGGYGSGIVPTSGTGTPITTTDWTLDNWGETLLACPLGGPIYEWSPTANNPVATIIPTAPVVNQGMFVAMPQRQAIAWGSTFNGIEDPLLIRWSDVDDYTTWAGQITNQAGSYRIPKGSRVVQCIQSAQQGLIWTDLGVWAMQYVGQPYVYQFNELGTGCGLIGRKAAASMGGVVYWMGQSQFYKLSGSGVEPIMCPVWDVIFQDLDQDYADLIRVAPNSRFGEISWYYPTTQTVSVSSIVGNGSSVTITYSSDISYIVGSEITVSGVAPATTGTPPPSYNGTYTVVASTSGSVSFASTKTYTYVSGGTLSGHSEPNAYVKYNIGLNQWDYGTLSRTAWINESVLGPPIGAGILPGGTGNFIVQHETSPDAVNASNETSPILASFQTGYFGGSQNATVQLTFYATDYPGSTPYTYGPYNLTQGTEYITPRFRGRLVSIKVESQDRGSFWRIGNMRYRIQQDGKF